MEINRKSELKPNQAFAAMLMCSLLWSTSSLFIKLIPWSGLSVAGVRSIFAASFLYAYLRFYEHKKIVINKAVVFAAIFICIKYITYTTANKFTTAANASALQYSSTVYILIFTAIVSRKFPPIRNIVIIILMIVGISLFFFGKFETSGFIGNMLASITGLCTAIMFFVSSRFKRLEENISSIILANIFTMTICIPFAVTEGIRFTPIAVGSIVFLGFFQQGLSFVFYSRAIRAVSPFTCSILNSIETILNPVLVFIVLSEMPSPYAVLGAVIVIGSVTIWSIMDYKTVKKQS